MHLKLSNDVKWLELESAHRLDNRFLLKALLLQVFNNYNGSHLYKSLFIPSLRFVDIQFYLISQTEIVNILAKFCSKNARVRKTNLLKDVEVERRNVF